MELSARFVAMRKSQVVNFALGIVLMPRAIDPQENLLRQILGRGLVANHARQEVDQRRAILPQ